MDKLLFLPIPATNVDTGWSTARDCLKLVPDPDVDVEAQAMSEIEAAHIRRLVASLPSLQRLVINLRYGLNDEPLSRRQVADRLRLSAANVRQIEADALRRLRCLVPELGEAA